MAASATNTQNWSVIAEKFPSTLVTTVDASKLADGQTPAAYGLGIDVIGRLYAGSHYDGTARATATAVAEPSNPPTTGLTWYYWFNRLWGFKSSSNIVYYGAAGYDTTYILQGFGKIIFDDTAGNVVNMFPVGEDIAVLKSACGYLIQSAGGKDGSFNRSHPIQGFGVSAAGYATELNGVAYASMSNGVYAFNGQQVIESTAACRSYAPLCDATLLADYGKGRIICSDTGKKFIMDVVGESPRIYDYSTDGFLWTSPDLVDATNKPVTLYDIALEVEYTDGAQGTMSYAVKSDDTWSEPVPYVFQRTNQEEAVRIKLGLATPFKGTRIAFRFAALSANVRIKRILALTSMSGTEAYRV